MLKKSALTIKATLRMKKNSGSRTRFVRAILLSLVLLLLVPQSGWSKTVRVAVLPWKVNSAENIDFLKDAMVDMLSSRLGSNASVEVIRPDAVRSVVAEKAEINDKVATDAGKKLKADFVLYGSLTVLGTAVSLDARLLNTATGATTPLYSKATGLDSVIGMADKLSGDVLVASGAVAVTPALPQVSVPPAAGVEIKKTLPPQTAPAPSAGEGGFIVKSEPGKMPVEWKSAKMDGMYISMTAADLNKDGVKEIFLLRKKSLVIARIKGAGLETVKEIPSGAADFIDVSSIDSDGDGVAEVYVSGLIDSRPYSSVVEFKDNDYRVTITGVEWLLKAVTVGSKAPVLAGSRFRRVDGFYGDLRVLKKEGTAVVDKGPFEIELPRKVNLYRFDAFDITGSGSLSLVALDSRDYLAIYKSDGKGGWDKDWTSSEYYGGTLNNIEFPGENTNGKPPVPVEGRFYHSATKDGKAELIIKRNNPGGLGRHAERPGSFVSGEVMSLSWDGSVLTENWKSKLVTGYISDFFIDDLNGDGTKEIVLLVVEGTGKLLGTPESYVLSYRLSI